MSETRLSPLGVLFVWAVSVLVIMGLLELIGLFVSIIGLIGSVSLVAVGEVAVGILFVLMLSAGVYNAYQKSRIMRKHRSILNDVDSDFDLKKEAYAEFLEDEDSPLTPDEELDELEDEYEDKRLSFNRGDKR